MTAAPETLEGWWALHDVRRVDWPRWKRLSPAMRDRIVNEAQAHLTDALEVRDAPEGASAFYRLLGHKGDWMAIHLRPDIEYLNALELRFAQTRLADYLLPAYSYVSVVEISRHHAGEERRGQQDRQREEPREWLENPNIRRRLFPSIPATRTVCFYPMSKKRADVDNWYVLDAERRRALMRDHGMIGRGYADRVVQIISGSTGLDDWEWGVTLFADDPLWYKKLIYEMRFDEASARYGLFGPFYIGIRLEPAELPAFMAGRVPAHVP